MTHGSSSSNTLPNEIWRLVFSFLNAKELCRCQCVCKDWKAVVISIDSTRWKDLYLKPKLYKRWKHPHWPNITKENSENILSWQKLYKQRIQQSNRWSKTGISVNCTGFPLFSRKRHRKKLCVGPNKQFKTLKSALDMCDSYDSIYVYPGTYEQQSKLSIRNSVEIVGVGNPEDIILVMEIQVVCSTVKFENLTLTPVFPRIRDLPSRNTFIPLLRSMNTHVYMFNCHIESGYIHIVAPGAASIHFCKFTRNSFLKFSHVSYSHVSNSLFETEKIAIFVEEPIYQYDSKMEEVGGWVRARNEQLFIKYYTENIKNKVSLKAVEDLSRKQSESSTSAIPESSSTEHESEQQSEISVKRMSSFKNFIKKPEDVESVLGSGLRSFTRGMCGLIVSNCKFHRGSGGIMVCRLGNIWVENSVFCNLSYGIRCLQNSKCALLQNTMYKIESTGIFVKDYCTALIAGNNIYENGEAGIDIRANADPIIQHNFIHNGKRSGIVCLDNGRGVIRENEIYDNKEAGIYILRYGNPKIRNNYISSGKAAGIAITEGGLGHISHNIISGVDWAGIDIRHRGNPVISHNMISHGKSDGIAVGIEGKSVIFDNDITGNSGCGIWVLDGAHPLIHSNRITNSGRSGIAFVQDSDLEHQNQEINNQFEQPNRNNINRQDSLLEPTSLIMEDDFFLFRPPFEHEPESRFVTVSKPEKRYPQVEGNIVSTNKGHGILYGGSDGVVITRNQIKNNSMDGIHLVNPSEITVQENSIKDNKKSGIDIQPGVCCAIHDNGVFNNQEYGIITAGSGVIKSNDIFDHSYPSIYVCSNADLYISENRLHFKDKAVIHVEAMARCTLNDNKIITTNPDADLFYIDQISEITREKDFVIEVIDDYHEDDFNSIKSLEISSSPSGSFTKYFSATVEIKPMFKEKSDAAPFYTALETQRPPRSNGSSFCIIL